MYLSLSKAVLEDSFMGCVHYSIVTSPSLQIACDIHVLKGCGERLL